MREKGLEGGADGPEFGEESEIESFLEVGDAGGAAGAGFEADDALDGFDVAEAPLMEDVFEVDEFFGEVVELPVFFRVAVDVEPGGFYFGGGGVGLFPVALQHGGRELEATAGEELQYFIVEAGSGEGGGEQGKVIGVVAMDLDHGGVFVAEEEF